MKPMQGFHYQYKTWYFQNVENTTGSTLLHIPCHNTHFSGIKFIWCLSIRENGKKMNGKEILATVSFYILGYMLIGNWGKCTPLLLYVLLMNLSDMQNSLT